MYQELHIWTECISREYSHEVYLKHLQSKFKVQPTFLFSYCSPLNCNCHCQALFSMPNLSKFCPKTVIWQLVFNKWALLDLTIIRIYLRTLELNFHIKLCSFTKISHSLIYPALSIEVNAARFWSQIIWAFSSANHWYPFKDCPISHTHMHWFKNIHKDAFINPFYKQILHTFTWYIHKLYACIKAIPIICMAFSTFPLD